MTNTLINRWQKLAVAIGLATALAVGHVEASIIWDEGVSGDLSGNQLVPSAFTLSLGTNSIIGTLRTSSSGDNQDWVALTIPGGLQLGAVVLASYSSADTTSFTGVGAGTNFPGSVGDPASYLGYTHFGTGPGNVGQDVLPSMGTAAGAQGFTPPLGSGTYTFLIQQTGTSPTAYQFDYVVIPEPSTLALVALGCAAMSFVRRKLRL